MRRGQEGQALPLVLVTAGLLMAGAVALFALGRAHVAVVRAQTVADVAAVSAARELRARLGEMAADPAGAASAPAWRARLAAVASAAAGPAGARLESLAFPDGAAWPPATVEVVVSVPAPRGMRARAVARAALLASAALPGGATGWASGGGYAGPLVYRDGKPMCPAVAAAFDLMDAAARADGVDLLVTSGFRSDAEQAVLFRRHPDPKWVAPPGRSRHRDATELDLNMLGGDGAHAWLRDNAGRFGFVQRYSWEPWHWGYIPGCGGGRAPGRPSAAAAGALPAWVPARYRTVITTAALRNGLQPVLLAALLRSESGFDPRAVSRAGAQGIAQFMPATARGMGVATRSIPPRRSRRPPACSRATSAASARCRWRWRPTTPGRAPSSGTGGSRRTRRRRPTSPGSSRSRAAPRRSAAAPAATASRSSASPAGSARHR